jgi:hypothetical protein
MFNHTTKIIWLKSILVLVMVFSVDANYVCASDWRSANETFHQIYEQEKQRTLAEAGPVLLVKDDKVILLNQGRRREMSDTASQYDDLKIIDHEVLSIYVLLRSKCNQPLDLVTLGRLSEIRSSCVETKADIANLELPQPAVRLQHEMPDKTIVFLDKVIKDNTISQSELIYFTRDVGAETLANADYATSARLSRLSSDMKDLLSPLSSAERKRLHVVVYGSHMAETGNAEVQFFEALLGESTEGNRIVYVENADSEEAGLKALSTHILDAEIGKAFYNDPTRMHRDLRCDAAKRYMSTHPSEKLE